MESPEKIEIAEDLRQSAEYGNYMEKIGWINKIIPGQRMQIFIRRIGPVAIAKLQRTKGRIPIKGIEEIIKKDKVFMVKIEPETLDEKAGDRLKINKYKISGWPLLGTKTLRVDLCPKEEMILSFFKKDCRYVLRKIDNEHSKIKYGEFDRFYEIWKKSAKRKKLWIPKKGEYLSLIEAFGNKAFSVTAGIEAGAVVLMHKETAFYYYAGSTMEGTKANLPYLVVWEAMKQAKRNGCLVWDFEGIYDKRWPNKGWQGFSHFKKSFGGVETEFPGSFQKWRWP